MGEHLAPLHGQCACAHEAVLLRVRENDADQRSGRQLIEGHQDRDEGTRVIERAWGVVVHTIEQRDARPGGEQRESRKRRQDDYQQSDE